MLCICLYLFFTSICDIISHLLPLSAVVMVSCLQNRVFNGLSPAAVVKLNFNNSDALP